VCTHGSNPELLCGPSTSPLEATQVLARKGKLIFGTIGSVLLTLGFVGFALRVYIHIRDGHGADTYDNVYGLHILWSQAAALLVSVPLIFVGTYALVRWQRWRARRGSQ
jgi:hypothetical protein